MKPPPTYISRREWGWDARPPHSRRRFFSDRRHGGSEAAREAAADYVRRETGGMRQPSPIVYKPSHTLDRAFRRAARKTSQDGVSRVIIRVRDRQGNDRYFHLPRCIDPLNTIGHMCRALKGGYTDPEIVDRVVVLRG